MTNRALFPGSQAVVVGGTGQTGRRLLEQLSALGLERVVAPSHVQLDLAAEPSAFEAQLERLAGELKPGLPTACIVAAAFTNVEACEADPAFCERVNVTNTIAALGFARDRFRAKLAFYSTDYVFDGAAGPYAETAARNPVSVYGRAKAKVEEWFEKHAPDGLVVRTTGVYDDLAGSKNFLMQMRALFAEKKTARVPSDQLANPVWAVELARATLELIERGESGLFHVAGGTQLPRVEFARLIAEVFGFDASLVQAVETSALGQKARRPLKGGLRCDKLRAALGWVPGGARETLLHIRDKH
jgi:dTDP-4-dehydrorhamnose reductase